jgi:peroxiredoxin
MNVYVKGAIAALVVSVGLFAWYQWKEPSLPVNQSPKGFQIIKQMEKEGVPEIALTNIDGKPVKLSDYRGKIVIVNFWASWCNPCVEEFPSMMKLISQFSDDVVVFAVSEDDTREDIQVFMKAMGLPKPGFEIVWDEHKENMKTWGVEKVPETFLVGRDGKLIRKVLGIENWANDDAVGYFKMLVSQADGKPAPPEAIAAPADDTAGEAGAADSAAEAGVADAPKAKAASKKAVAKKATAKKSPAKKSSKKKSKKKKH